MLPIEQETNLEVLRQYAILYRDEAKRLATENTELKDGKASEAQGFLHARLKDQLSRLKKKFFGFGREELQPKTARPVGHKQQRLRLHGKRPHVEKLQAGKAKKRKSSIFPVLTESQFALKWLGVKADFPAWSSAVMARR